MTIGNALAGNITLQSATSSTLVVSDNGTAVTGTLSSTGNFSVNTDKFTVNAATGNTAVAGTLGVLGQTTTNGLGNTGTLANTGAFNQTGTSTLVGITNINTTGTAATAIGTGGGNTSIGSAASTNTVLGTTSITGTNTIQSATLGNNNRSVITTNATQASVQFVDATGDVHGLIVNGTQTTLSGGTNSTTMTLDDNGASFANHNGAPVRVTGVADGTSDFDAVNVRQFAGAIASAVAMSNIPGVDTNKQASFGVGIGDYMGKQALALGGSYRFSANGVIKISLAANTSGTNRYTTGVGAGWSW